MALQIKRIVGYNEIASNIRMCSTTDEIADIIQKNPDLMYSANCNAALLQAITRVAAKSSENFINLRLVYNIFAAGRYRTKVDVPNAPDQYGLPSTKEVFSCYIYTLVEYHGSSFLDNPLAVEKNKVYISEIPSKRLQNNYRMLLAPIYLIIQYSRWDNRDMKLWIGLHRQGVNGGFRTDYAAWFLDLFADVAVPMDRPTEAIKLALWFWKRNAIDPNDLRESPMMKYIRANDPTALHSILSKAYLNELDGDPNVVSVSNVVEDATGMLMQFGNTLYNVDIQAMYFDEMVSMLSTQFPLDEEREEVAEKYKDVFGEDSPLYMADIYAAIMTSVSQMGDWKDIPDRVSNRDNPNYRYIHMRIEGIILDMLASHSPEYSAVIAFFEDTLKAFSYRFQEYVDGARPGIINIVQGIFDDYNDDTKMTMSADSVMEAYQHYLEGMDAVMEGSYDDGNELKTVKKTNPVKKTPTTTQRSRVDDLDAHSKAGKSEFKSKVQTVKEGAHEARKGIQKSWNKYKEIEGEVDRGLTNVAGMVKRGLEGDQNTILIEGKKYTVLGVLKKAIFSVAIFNYSKIAAILGLVLKKVMGNKAKTSERRKVYQELEEELELVEEKIRDAEADGNRDAKYALMRTRSALMNAKQRIKYGQSAETPRSRLNSNIRGYGG